MAKVYFCKFTDKATLKVFYKFGHTSHSDVLKRFDTFFDPRYGAFDIKCVASIYNEDVKWCQQIEEMFKALFPKNIWLEEYLGDSRTWDNFSGITEIVSLTNEEYKRVVSAFYKLKEMRSEV